MACHSDIELEEMKLREVDASKTKRATAFELWMNVPLS